MVGRATLGGWTRFPFNWEMWGLRGSRIDWSRYSFHPTRRGGPTGGNCGPPDERIVPPLKGLWNIKSDR